MAEVEYTTSCAYIMQNIENLITGIIVPLNELKVVKLFEILNLHSWTFTQQTDHFGLSCREI